MSKRAFAYLSFTFCSLFLAPGKLIAVDTDYTQRSAIATFQQNDDFVDELDAEFDDIEAKLESQFLQTDAQLEARYEAVHKAIQLAYKKQSAKIEVHWPTNVIVPTGTVWVAYSDDYQERLVYDFEQGFYELEVSASDNPQESLTRLTKFVESVSNDEANTLESLDVFKHAIEKEVLKIEPLLYQESQSIESAESINDKTKKEIKREIARVRPQNKSGQADIGISQLTLLSSQNNYNILASLSPDMPTLDVEHLLTRLKSRDSANTVTAISPPREQAANVVRSAQATLANDAPDLVEAGLALSETSSGWKIKIPFVNGYQKTLIDQQMQTINEMSSRFDVNVSLILAIIEAESSFNPMATSHIPAFGLMQLVPQTAGVDAYRHIYGERKVLSPDYLYDIENNLKLGTAYIDLLQSRYLRGIDDTQNKLYSMIASYNTGVGNLALTVSGEKSIRGAIPLINKMKANEYYAFLQENLPALETKRYLDKVITNSQKYKHLDE